MLDDVEFLTRNCRLISTKFVISRYTQNNIILHGKKSLIGLLRLLSSFEEFEKSSKEEFILFTRLL